MQRAIQLVARYLQAHNKANNRPADTYAKTSFKFDSLDYTFLYMSLDGGDYQIVTIPISFILPDRIDSNLYFFVTNCGNCVLAQESERFYFSYVTYENSIMRLEEYLNGQIHTRAETQQYI